MLDFSVKDPTGRYRRGTVTLIIIIIIIIIQRFFL